MMNFSDKCSSCSVDVDHDSLLSSIQALRDREQDYMTGDYLHQRNQRMVPGCIEPVDVECRRKMCEWSMQIIDHCRFSRESVAIAMNVLDRFLESNPSLLMDRSVFQLASITCLYTTVKIHEAQAISLNTMASLSQNIYSVQQIETMERFMLQNIRWLLHPPTTFAFGRCFCQLLPQGYNDVIYDLTRLQLELAIRDYDLSMAPPSYVALAAVMNAVDSIDFELPIQNPLELLLEYASKIDPFSEEIQNIQKQLYQGLLNENVVIPHINNNNKGNISGSNYNSVTNIPPQMSCHQPESPRSVLTSDSLAA